MTGRADRGTTGTSKTARPQVIEIAAAVLVLGGLFGLSQLLVGDYVITGSLPAKVPILGVALVLYLASTILGVTVRIGRGWLPALNLAGIFAVLLLLAMDRLANAVMALAYAVAFVILLRERRWFAAVSGARPRPPT